MTTKSESLVDGWQSARGGRWRSGWGRRLALGIVVAVVLFFPISMLVVHSIDDDPDFVPPPALDVAGGSRAVAMAAALVDREVNETGWVANAPFPFPSHFLDNMPNFQLGVVYAVSRFAVLMSDQLGRTRGTSQVDPDLDKAAGAFKYDGTRWFWRPSVSLLPTASAESEYRAGVRSLTAYNRRLAAGQAVYDRRADNLVALLESVAADLGSASAAIAERIGASGTFWFDTEADDLFYANKGRLYAYYMILREVGHDFAGVLAERRAEAVWKQMLDSLRAGAELHPLIVSNAAADSVILPNHLTTQGFYLLRSRTQIREVASVLAN